MSLSIRPKRCMTPVTASLIRGLRRLPTPPQGPAGSSGPARGTSGPGPGSAGGRGRAFGTTRRRSLPGAAGPRQRAAAGGWGRRGTGTGAHRPGRCGPVRLCPGQRRRRGRHALRNLCFWCHLKAERSGEQDRSVGGRIIRSSSVATCSRWQCSPCNCGERMITYREFMPSRPSSKVQWQSLHNESPFVGSSFLVTLHGIMCAASTAE
jgi:hypothetical protein